MLSNNLTLALALRSLAKHRSYTLISLFGLGAGIFSALVLVLYAYQELTFDTSHTKRDKIFYVAKERLTPTGAQIVYDTWMPTLDVFRQEYPQIVEGARRFTQKAFITINGQQFAEDVDFADPEIFRVFDLPLESGDGYNVLRRTSDVVISTDMALRLFGTGDPRGKTMQLRFQGKTFDLAVGGVLLETPVNSSIRPGMVVAMQNVLTLEMFREPQWSVSFLDTFIITAEKDDTAELNALFPAVVKKIFDEETATRMKFVTIPLPELHNQLTQSNRAAYIMLCIALIILVIAVVNYINLATVRSVERAREIGLRKVLGATRFGLVKQFLSESVIMTAVAFLTALLFLQLSLPFINAALDISLSLKPILRPFLLITLIALFLIIGVLSGSFPAFFITAHKTVESIKGKMKSSTLGTILKRTLIVVQFSLSVVLLFSTLVIYRQVQFMRDHELGITNDNVLVIPTDTDNMADPQSARTRVALLKKQLLQHAQIKGVSSSNVVPSDLTSTTYTLVRPDGWTEERPMRLMRPAIDEAYFPLFDVPIIEGSNFSEDLLPRDTGAHAFAIINEAALKAFGWESSEGKRINTWMEVVGVVKDHHYVNVAEKIEPIVFIYRPTERQSSSYISVRLQGDPATVIPFIEQKWKTLDTSRPFSYFFVDESFDNLYRTDDRNTKIVTWFSGLAIVIACMGLLGLISFTVNQKIKEIGIRKVLGSSDTGIILLLNKEFVVLVSLAIAAALPVAAYLMNLWLTDFAVKVEIQWWLYAIVVLTTLLLAFATTSLRIWKAAGVNPVESLRAE